MAQNVSSPNITSILNDNRTQVFEIDDDDWSAETLERARFIVQRIIVPCIVAIGMAGNLLTVIVLTRRRMRCSTNIYLTALAIADIVFLFFVFVLSLQQYPHYKYGHGLYWSSFGLSNWFHDATLYSSVYLTVSFTLERYISVCHPLRGQVLCTESRAKKVITAVFILCFLCTITTRFEFELIVDHKRFDYSIGEPCDRNDSLCVPVPWYQIEHSNLSLAAKYHNLFHYPSAFFGVLLPFVLLAILNGFLIWTVRKSQKMRHTMANTRQSDKSQENKVTITLIAVVILFLICQTPNTFQMLNIMHQSKHKNKQRVMNNIYNLLLAVNAASNFILYCLLSDKYRKTVKALLCGTRPIRRNTLSSSRFTSARTTSSFYSRSHNSGLFNMTFRKKRPRFSITKEEYANLQAETSKRGRFSIISAATPNSRNNSMGDVEQHETIPMKESIRKSVPEKSRMKNIRFSFTPSIHIKSKPKNNGESILKVDGEKPKVTELTEITVSVPEIEQAASTEAQQNDIDNSRTQATNKSLLRPSPSETSLTRSRSLVFPPLPKHSPDCKDNPYKF